MSSYLQLSFKIGGISGHADGRCCLPLTKSCKTRSGGERREAMAQHPTPPPAKPLHNLV